MPSEVSRNKVVNDLLCRLGPVVPVEDHIERNVVHVMEVDALRSGPRRTG